MPQIVFLTLFLGLTSGPGSVSLQADPAVKSVRIELGGKELAVIRHPPWSANVDFGAELVPQALVAIGYDSDGREIARASQILNLPRPPAEVEISIAEVNGTPAIARVIGRNMVHSPAAQSELSIDGKTVSLDANMRAVLPQLDWSRPHVLSAVVHFQNGQVARRESVLQGGVGEAVSSEMTPVLVTRGDRHDPPDLGRCFSLNGTPLRTGSLEKPKALVVIVKGPDTAGVYSRLQPVSIPARGTWWEDWRFRGESQLDGGTGQMIMWPVPNEFAASGEPTYSLFPYSNEVDARKGGVSWMLTRPYGGVRDPGKPTRFADAVAVAALMSVESGRRRAVVLLLGNGDDDRSSHSPAAVRRYLARIGVPLFVWSLEAPAADLAASWGEVQDISTRRGIIDAVAKLNSAMREQRIAWLATDALNALAIKATGQCALEPIAAPAAP